MAVELPEALTLARQMDSQLGGKTVSQVILSQASASLVRQGFINLHEVSIAHLPIGAVTSQGKWIFVWLEPEMLLLYALETGGKLLFHAVRSAAPPKFHVQIIFEDGSTLTEQIVGWGWAKAVKRGDLDQLRYPGRLGVSPLDESEFTPAALAAILAENGKKNLRAVLLDQSQIAGIGNGYAQEILFAARLHPARKAASLSQVEREALFRSIRGILQEAVRLGGNEYDLYDRLGGYQKILGAHSRGKPCPRCGTLLEKLALQGAGVYFCPVCQI